MKIKKKKLKKGLEIPSFYTCVSNIMIRCTVPDIWCTTDGQMNIQTDGKSDI